MPCSDRAANASSLALNAVSAALMCSNIPWNGPLAAVHMACNESQQGIIVQPSMAEAEASSMSGIFVGTAHSALLADFQVKCYLVFFSSCFWSAAGCLVKICPSLRRSGVHCLEWQLISVFYVFYHALFPLDLLEK